MLPRADIANVVQPVASIEAPTGIVSVADAKQEAFSRLAQIAIGQQLMGKVIATFNDGTHLVRIANTAARMVLPSASRTGDSMLLTLVSKDPRPTFSIANAPVSEEDNADTPLSVAGRMMGKGLQTLNAAQQGAASVIKNDGSKLVDNSQTNQQASIASPESTKTLLSTAGKLITTLLHTSQDSNVSNAIKAPIPLVSNPNVNTTQLASALHDTITLSGVFYEAHVAAWAQGNRPLAEIQKEPQVQISRQQQVSTTDLMNHTDPAHTQLGQIINLQLNAIEQQRIMWQGEVWPGQKMEWEISQEQSDTPKNEQENTDMPSWQSVVRFHFKHLGAISASIRLIGQQIHIQVRTDNDTAATALRVNGDMLTNAMAAAGSALDSLIVKRDEDI